MFELGFTKDIPIDTSRERIAGVALNAIAKSAQAIVAVFVAAGTWLKVASFKLEKVVSSKLFGVH